MKELIQYLEENVTGRTLYTDELTYELDGGKLEGVYSDQISFSNLKYSKTSCQMDMFIVSNEKIYRVEEGCHAEVTKDYSAVSLFRFELAQRKSTGKVTGLFRFISASLDDVPADAVVSGISEIKIEKGTLSMKEDQVLYRDQPTSDDEYRPIAFVSTHSFCLENGKLRYEYRGDCFDVNPSTLTRSKSLDVFPSFISRER